MDLKGLALLSLSLAAALCTVEAVPEVLSPLEYCPCPGGGDGCVCLDPQLCTGGSLGAGSGSCSSPERVCCSPEDVGRPRRQAGGNDVYLDECGVATPSYEHPWVVNIYAWPTDTNHDYVPMCPGVLIHPQVVLTSADCTPKVEDDDEFLVYVLRDQRVQQTRLVTKVGYHDYFDENKRDFDIALIYVDAPFVLGDNVRVLCMPQRDKPLDTQRCFSTKVVDQSGNLQKTSMELKEYVEDCEDLLTEEDREKYHFPDYSSFCAISRDGVSLCDGEQGAAEDEGSALVCPLASSPDRMAVGGVVSVALSCSDAQQPIFYTNTTYFATWLQVRLALVQLDNFAIPP